MALPWLHPRRCLLMLLSGLVLVGGIFRAGNLYGIQLGIGQFDSSDPVITFETGSTALPSIPGVHLSGGDSTFFTDDFGHQVFGNFNGATYLDIYFDQPQQAVGAFIIYGGTIIETVFDQNDNIIESASATSTYPAPFLGLGEPTPQIYHVQWRYVNPAYFAVDNV